jgi:hypothetical protein
MKKLLFLQILCLSLLSELASPLNTRWRTELGLGYIVNEFPLTAAEYKVPILDFSWRKKILGKKGSTITLDILSGAMFFFVIPVPRLGLSLGILPESGTVRLLLDGALAYDLIYGGMFAADLRVGVLIKKRFSFQLLIIPILSKPKVLYQPDPKSFFEKIVYYNEGEPSFHHFPKTLFGFTVAYHFKSINKRKSS